MQEWQLVSGRLSPAIIYGNEEVEYNEKVADNMEGEKREHGLRRRLARRVYTDEMAGKRSRVRLWERWSDNFSYTSMLLIRSYMCDFMTTIVVKRESPA